RTIAADDVDRLLAADVAIDLPQEIDLLRVHLGGLVLAPVAQDPVDLLQRGVVVLAVALVGDGEVFAGVDVMQRNGAGVAQADGAGLLEGQRTGKHAEGGETDAWRRELQARSGSGVGFGTNWHKRSRIKGAAQMLPPHAATWLTQS